MNSEVVGAILVIARSRRRTSAKHRGFPWGLPCPAVYSQEKWRGSPRRAWLSSRDQAGRSRRHGSPRRAWLSKASPWGASARRVHPYVL